MAEFIDTKEQEEKVILVAVSLSDNDDTEESLDELDDLVETAGAIVIDRVTQKRDSVHPGTYIGKGKIEEIKELIYNTGATGIVCDDELSPAQYKNLEDALEIKVMDRTLIILDIFASRAKTREGKIQVELAQLKYSSTRLIGLRKSLARIGGGVGTGGVGGGIGARGPGEKKLEMDRRLIKEKITWLNHELSQIKKNRDVLRQQRSKNPIPIVAIVGYTNAGKSTLLNTLTNAGVLEEDKLFATLDPTTRNLQLQSGQQILLTDTVGFIRKLPHHLIEAFKSTLEEAKYADIILHMVDSSNPQADKQMHVVYETLSNLGIKDKLIITAFNKLDKVEDNQINQVLKDFNADKTIKISAKYNNGIDNLLDILESVLRERKMLIEKVFNYNESSKIQNIRKFGQLLIEEYREDGIYVRAYVPKDVYMGI